MDQLAAMRVFVEIVDRGSLTAAAASLGRSQPAVVRTLAALETHLGTQLLRRTTRHMALTPEGQDYLVRCRRILADVEEAERAVGQEQGEPRGYLRVTAPVQFGTRYIAPAVAGFLRRFRNIRVDLLLLDRVVDLVEEEIDVAVRISHLADSSMIAVRVGQISRLVCASPALLLGTGVPAHPRDLAGLPCIRQQHLMQGSAWSFLDGTKRVVVSVDGRFGCNQIAAAVAACEDGLGFGQFLSYQVAQAVNAGRLVRILQAFEPKPLPVSLIYAGGRLLSIRQRLLIDWLKTALQDSSVFT